MLETFPETAVPSVNAVVVSITFRTTKTAVGFEGLLTASTAPCRTSVYVPVVARVIRSESVRKPQLPNSLPDESNSSQSPVRLFGSLDVKPVLSSRMVLPAVPENRYRRVEFAGDNVADTDAPSVIVVAGAEAKSNTRNE